MNLEILQDLLSEADLGTPGVGIFNYEMPAEVQEGIVLRIPVVGVTNDPYLPGFYKGKVQLIVRSKTRSVGREKIYLAIKALESQRIRNFTSGGNLLMRINYLVKDHLPVTYHRSDGNGIEWSVNFNICFVSYE